MNTNNISNMETTFHNIINNIMELCEVDNVFIQIYLEEELRSVFEQGYKYGYNNAHNNGWWHEQEHCVHR